MADHTVEALRLSQDASETVVGDHQLDPQTQTVVDGATVQISATDQSGNKDVHGASGFLTSDSNGKLLAITAAHVVLDYRSLDKLIVTDNTGATSTVVAGCIIYESALGLEPQNPPSDEIDNDVAALVLKDSIGTHTLDLSRHRPRRGTWYTTVNLGGYPPPDRPNRYNILALGTTRYGTGDAFWVLSGLQPWRRHHAATDYTTHGASGGVVTTIPANGADPMVVGILVGGIRDRPADPTLLRDIFGVEFARPHNATPKIDFLTPVDVIAAAIDANHIKAKR